MIQLFYCRDVRQQTREGQKSILKQPEVMKTFLKQRKLLISMFWSILLGGLFIFPLNASQGTACKIFPEISQEEWESYPKRKGEYENCPFLYTITIPKGFIGRGEAPSHSEHGFGMWLSSKPHGYIWVDGSAASPEGDNPLDEEADKRIEWIEKDAQEILSVQKTYTMLDSLPAIRLIVRYICPIDRIMVEDYFLALHGSAYEYTIALSADVDKYEEYKIILEQLAKTFRLKSCE